MSEPAPNSNFTNEKETRKIVTPFAFKVHDSLLGKRLASPGRRLLSIVLDMFFISLLTLLPSVWLSVLILAVVGFSLYQLRGRSGKGGAKVALCAVGGLTAFVVGSQLLLGGWLAGRDVDISVGQASPTERALTAAKVLADAEQALVYTNTDVDHSVVLTISEIKGADGSVACAEGQECGADFFDALITYLVAQEQPYDDASLVYVEVRDLLHANSRLDRDMTESTLSARVYEQRSDADYLAELQPGSNASLLAWVKGVLADLGLSFGWAAVYFSVLTAWWNGQTLGKRLLGIQVMRIDAKPINLWESIGRYGGYSAGLGTGLLGFLQIYWDANRQAIQDKISETLVIRL